MTDPRCHPLVDLDPRDVRAMLAPLTGGAELSEVMCVEGGLVNTVYRVRPRGEETAYGLRLYADGRAAFEFERRLLAELCARLPTPGVLFADAGGRRGAWPYLVYRWLDGVTLNEARRRAAPDAFLKLARPLGRLLARIWTTPLPAVLSGGRHAGRSAETLIAERLARAEERLRAGRARGRLGPKAADALRSLLEKNAPRLHALDQARGLVHGDFGGRNVLVREEGGGWAISGVLDWEQANAGATLWDVGSLFRYPRRYSAEFRRLFARGYRDAGGELSRGWWRTARLLDATRVVEFLNGERDLPCVYAECREIVGALIDGNHRAG